MPSGLLSILPGGPETALRLVSRPAVRAVSLTGGAPPARPWGGGRHQAGLPRARRQLPEHRLCRCGRRTGGQGDRRSGVRRERAAVHLGAAGDRGATGRRHVRGVVRPLRRRWSGRSRRLGHGHWTARERPCRERVRRHLDDAEARRQARPRRARRRPLFGPSIVLDVPGDALILQEEVFGPVAARGPGRLRRRGDRSCQRQRSRLSRLFYLEPGDGDARGRGAAGRIGLDQRADALPSGHVSRGGYGTSGIGREGVRYAMEALSQLKFIGLRAT